MKKYVAIILIMLLMIGVFSACSDQNEDEEFIEMLSEMEESETVDRPERLDASRDMFEDMIKLMTEKEIITVDEGDKIMELISKSDEPRFDFIGEAVEQGIITEEQAAEMVEIMPKGKGARPLGDQKDKND